MKKLVTNILLFLTCIVPLLVNPYGKEPFSFPKSILIYAGCLILLAAVVWFIKQKSFKLILPIQNTLILIYLLFCILSLINSKNIYLSLLGRAGRREGLIAIACYIIMFLIASYYYEFNVKHLKYIALASIPISILALFQFAGHDFVLGFTEGMFYKNSFSTIGNRNFLGSYICLVLPLMIFSYIYLKDKLFYFTSCLLFLSLLSSLTRSAWLSLSILTILIIIFAVRRILPYRRLIALFASFTILFLIYDHINNNIFIGRYSSIYSNASKIDDSSGSNRIFIWNHTLIMIADHPFLGTGVDNFAEVFMKDFKEDVAKKYPSTTFDKAHNEFLHIAATTGIPSLMTYISFWAILFIKSLKYIKSDKRVLVIFCSILAYQMQAFFNISVVAVAPIMWILAGILNGILRENEISKIPVNENSNEVSEETLQVE